MKGEVKKQGVLCFDSPLLQRVFCVFNVSRCRSSPPLLWSLALFIPEAAAGYFYCEAPIFLKKDGLLLVVCSSLKVQADVTCAGLYKDSDKNVTDKYQE